MLLKRSLAAAGLSVLALTTLSGCGSDRPSAEEVSKVLQDGNDAGTKQASDCVGKVLVQSELSDETLVKIVETDGKYFDEDEAKLPKADQAVIKSDEFLNGLSDCIEAALPDEEFADGGSGVDPSTVDEDGKSLDPSTEVVPDPSEVE